MSESLWVLNLELSSKKNEWRNRLSRAVLLKGLWPIHHLRAYLWGLVHRNLQTGFNINGSLGIQFTSNWNLQQWNYLQLKVLVTCDTEFEETYRRMYVPSLKKDRDGKSQGSTAHDNEFSAKIGPNLASSRIKKVRPQSKLHSQWHLNTCFHVSRYLSCSGKEEEENKTFIEMAVFHQASKTQMSLALFILNYKQQRCYWKINTALCHYSIIFKSNVWLFNLIF